ncbi:EVE domain-containing protein [Chloroflexota bacterium]
MAISLTQILSLVGKLDDTPGDDTARERFRQYLKENVKNAVNIRDYVQECISISGDQYNRALQDLINYLGHFLGFDVSFGRYSGIRGELGYDGLWISPSGFNIVVEVKTTEAYSIKTSTLIGYINGLIDERKITDKNQVLGLYVIGRYDSDVNQINNAILAQRRTDELRTISADSLLSLAELRDEYDITHDDVLSILKPSGPSIDKYIDLMTRMVAQRQSEELTKEAIPEVREMETDETNTYWITPVKSDEDQTAEKVISSLVGVNKIYAIGERTPGRRIMKTGDHICFYATTKGIVAHATLDSKPEKNEHPEIKDNEKYNWIFRLSDTKLYLDKPIIIDANLRNQLDEFHDRDPNKGWSWFVQSTRRVTEHDFNILTGK